jgi:hypothetical protein
MDANAGLAREMLLDGGKPAAPQISSGMEDISAAAGGSGKVYAIATKAAEGKKRTTKTMRASAEGRVIKPAPPAKIRPAGAKTRMKTMRVQQAYVDSLLEDYPFKPFPGDPEELEKNIRDPETREQLRIALAPATAALKAIRDKDEAVVKQYFALGYAEEEVEVTDDEEEEAPAA